MFLNNDFIQNKLFYLLRFNKKELPLYYNKNKKDNGNKKIYCTRQFSWEYHRLI